MKTSILCLMLGLASLVGQPFGGAAEELADHLVTEPGPGPDRKPSVDVVELFVHPTRPPRASLQYPLLPSYFNKSYGNAAPLYTKAILLARPEPEMWSKVDDWGDAPLDELPLDDVRNTLSSFNVVFEQLVLASRRTHCDWGLPIWETDNVYGVMLPEIQESRNLARIVAIRVRLAIAEEDFDEAIRSLQVGFNLACHVGDQPILVGSLVGIAIAEKMTDQVEALVQLPNAPNLYWSLTALPRPLINLREAIEMESAAIHLMFPQLADVKTTEYTSAQWEALYDEEEIIGKFAAFLELEPGDTSAKKKELREKLKKAYPVAKRELAARGCSPADLDRMPVSQVVVLHLSLRFDELRDGMFKWFYLPYPQARAGVKAAQQEVEDAGDAIGLAGMVLPAVAACQVAGARMERRIAALRCVEAIRLYAAVHEGKLPASLDDVTEVPLPVNPFTGEPFEYRQENNTAVLEATSGGAENCRPRQYRMTLAD